MTLYAHYDMSC